MANLIKLLGDSVWQLVGIILALLAIVVPILIYFLQQTRKSLTYEIVYSTPLLTIKEELEGKLQLLFESNHVKNVQLIIIRVINSGNMSISSTDYERPLRFVFGETSKVLSAEIIGKNPNDLITSVCINKNKIEFAPTLLNSKDTITVKAFISDYKESPKVEARIIGVKKVDEVIRILPVGSVLPLIASYVIIFVGMALFFYKISEVVGLIFMLVGFSFLTAVLTRKVWPYYERPLD